MRSKNNFLKYWIEKAFGVKIASKMAVKITSIRKILDELNGKNKTAPWVPLNGVTFLSQAQIKPVDQIYVGPDGLVLKAFINTSTGEIKTYLAKWTDAPETNTLP